MSVQISIASATMIYHHHGPKVHRTELNVLLHGAWPTLLFSPTPLPVLDVDVMEDSDTDIPDANDTAMELESSSLSASTSSQMGGPSKNGTERSSRSDKGKEVPDKERPSFRVKDEPVPPQLPEAANLTVRFQFRSSHTSYI